jgi:hypothetical protein
MKGNFLVRFLGVWGAAMPSGYPVFEGDLSHQKKVSLKAITLRGWLNVIHHIAESLHQK